MHESHESRPKIIKRLKRAEGHLKSVLKMFEEKRTCLELAQQLHAVEKAIANAKETMVQDHIEHCLDHGLTDGTSSQDVIKEFKEITKYL